MLACVLERSNFSLAIRDCLLKIICFIFEIYKMNADRERAHPYPAIIAYKLVILYAR